VEGGRQRALGFAGHRQGNRIIARPIASSAFIADLGQYELMAALQAADQARNGVLFGGLTGGVARKASLHAPATQCQAFGLKSFTPKTSLRRRNFVKSACLMRADTCGAFVIGCVD
jgi:hypothetical protein